MALGRKARDVEADPFYDMLFNILIAFVFCFVVAMLAFHPDARKSGDIRAKAEFIITMSWPDSNPNDVDTWVRDPAGDVLWFRQRDAGLMHLDRDDRGSKNNSVVVNGREIVNPIRQEMATLRGIVPGEYIVNAHYYESRDQQPVDVEVAVVKVNPQADIVYTGQMRLSAPGAEQTLVRFTLDATGQVSDINTTAYSMVQTLGRK
jgi:hypothetical protein